MKLFKRFDHMKESVMHIFSKKEKDPLRAKKVTFGYADTEILKELSLSVKSSQIMAVLGKSGSGKSTFLNLVAGVITSSHGGRISILGNTTSLAKEDIGFVPQEIAVIKDMTLEENIIFFGSLNGIPSHLAKERGEELMNILQLDVPITRFPTELSGGQNVRLNIIVSLLHQPKVIILDEPFVGLDYKNRKLLWHFLTYQKNRRRTIILTTHMLTEAQAHADRLVLLNEGKIAAKGHIEDIRKKLGSNFIVELQFPQLSKTNRDKILKYCAAREIVIMDIFGNSLMLSVQTTGQRNYLLRFFEKENIRFEELGFRQPNLDELFLTVKT